MDHPPTLPDRHILVLIDFQDLEQLAHRGDARSRNFDLLDTHNYQHCSPIEITCLFSWSRQYPPDEARLCVLSGLCGLVSFPLDQLELRYQDLWGDTFQVDMSLTIIQILDIWRLDGGSNHLHRW